MRKTKGQPKGKGSKTVAERPLKQRSESQRAVTLTNTEQTGLRTSLESDLDQSGKWSAGRYKVTKSKSGLKVSSSWKGGPLQRVYSRSEVEDMLPIVEKAAALWKFKIQEFVKKRSEFGACVIGEGINVFYLGNRKRNATELTILSPRTVTDYQGSCVWEASADEIIAFLNVNGIEARWDCGRMD